MSERRSPFETKVTSFEPKDKGRRRPAAHEIDKTSTLPVREVVASASEGKVTLGINCSPSVKERFRAICASDRRTSEDMLVILMNKYDEQP